MGYSAHAFERDHAQNLIDWLSDQTPDVWYAVSQELNWDSAARVLDWIVSQPNCDKANAAWVFWAADPGYYAERLAAGRTPEGEGYHLMQKVLRRWRSGFYQRAELEWRAEESAIDRYFALENDRFSIPDALYEPLRGRAPAMPLEAHDLVAPLGGWMEPQPRSASAEAQAESEWRDATIFTAIGDVLIAAGNAMAWIGVGGALVLGVIVAAQAAGVI